MKLRSALVLLAIIALAGCRNNTVTISGTLESPTLGEYIYLDELMSDRLKPVDSVKIGDGGKYAFSFDTEHPSMYILRFSQNNFLTLVVSPGEKISIGSHRDSLNFPSVIRGSAGTENVVRYNNALRKTVAVLGGLNETYMKNIDNPRLPAVIDSLDSVAEGYLTEINQFTKDYIDSNLGSLETLIALYQQVAPAVPVLNAEEDLAWFVKVDSALFRQYPQYEPVMSLHKQVQLLVENFGGRAEAGPAPGERALAPDISLPGPEGDTITLSSTRGSVVLLDFWAAWCGPCRMENPNLVAAYDKYRRKGFQIYQVSIDKTKEAWLKGIEDDKLGRWIHVSDLQYWNSPVLKLYNVESIPSNFLLDREGNIIARNLRGDALLTKLAEVFGK
ncbi:MAG: AhpC/TSA family protein [Bacteroidales bacterium]|jgi:thiol-disulfide isomerase/thioredoxin|nr:AhpC/TSA family protein [Bacteroidales bacterium]